MHLKLGIFVFFFAQALALRLPHPRDDPEVFSFNVYIFNVENPDEILDGAKPVVRQVGPYAYKETRIINVFEEDSADDTESYSETFTLEFDKAASGGLSEDDIVTVINAPLNALLQGAEDLPLDSGIVGETIQQLFPPDQNTLFIDISVKALLFDGQTFCQSDDDDNEIATIVCSEAAKIRSVDNINGDPTKGLNFTYFKYKLKDPSGFYTIIKGESDTEHKGEIVEYNNSTTNNVWGEPCNELAGSDGTVFHTNVQQDDVFATFITDICRSIDISFMGEVTASGYPGYKFGVSNDTFVEESPESSCYCLLVTKDVNGEPSCFLDGVIDMASCLGVQALLSFPHFLGADEKYLQGVEGLEPDAVRHESYVYLEPGTGSLLGGARRLQLNAVLRKLDPALGYPAADNLAGSVLPVVWLEQGIF